jgi:hypothetical protein
MSRSKVMIATVAVLVVGGLMVLGSVEGRGGQPAKPSRSGWSSWRNASQYRAANL